MAKHHQLNMYYKQAGISGERSINFLYDGDTLGEGEVVMPRESFPALYNQMCELTDAEVDEVFVSQ